MSCKNEEMKFVLFVFYEFICGPPLISSISSSSSYGMIIYLVKQRDSTNPREINK